MGYEVRARDLRNNENLRVRIVNDEASGKCKFSIYTQDMELASDIVQDFLGEFLKL